MDPLRLVGTWDFQRQVQHSDGAEYTARGEAEFISQDDTRIRWAERGTLVWASGSTPISRTLFLVRVSQEDGPDGLPRWHVTFEDGRDFHPWTVGAVEHLCGLDLYRGGVDVPAEPAPQSEPEREREWELHWRVTGPEKDYTMDTHYTRPR